MQGNSTVMDWPLVHAQICAEGCESGGAAILLSSFYNELSSVSGGCYEMVLPPALKEQIVHKVLLCFSLLSKGIYKYLKSFNCTLFNAWWQQQRLGNAVQWSRTQWVQVQPLCTGWWHLHNRLWSHKHFPALGSSHGKLHKQWLRAVSLAGFHI